MAAVVASRPVGLAAVSAMGTFYFIVAPCFRGFVSAGRLSHIVGTRSRLTQLFVQGDTFIADG